MHVATKAKVLYHWLEYGRSEAFQAELVGKIDKSTAAASGLSADGKVGWTFGGSPTSAAETHLQLRHQPAVITRGWIRDDYNGK